MKKNLFFIIIFAASVSFSQTIFYPVNGKVYDFLERETLKGLINWHNEVKPLQRETIARFIAEIEMQQDKLNPVEKEELEWYKKEFANELGLKEKRLWLYEYSDSLFTFTLSPVVGYKTGTFGGKTSYGRSIGAYVYGVYGKQFGGSFEYRDSGEFGDAADRDKKFTPETGHFTKKASNGFEFSDVKGSVVYGWKWGSISLVKDYMTWGHGKYGQLILSTKAASYPQIRFFMQPVEWLRFYYMHGWLQSYVPDSAYFYYDNISSIRPYLHEQYVPKYIAANLLSITPVSWLDVSLGNSFIYAGDLRPEMFIPFMYYKVMDHNTGRGGVGDGNGQLFFDVAVKYPKEYMFYSTLYIESLEIKNVLSSNFWNTWFGFTLGGKKVDLFVPNLDITLEYTRLNPWVYEHKDESTTYKHLNYTLGDWIGQNADQFRLQLDYQFIRGLRSSLWLEKVRKGGLKDIYYAYYDKAQEPFLYGPLRKDSRIGLDVSYEVIHDLTGKISYVYSDITDEDKTRTPEWMLGSKHSFSVSLFYGL